MRFLQTTLLLLLCMFTAGAQTTEPAPGATRLRFNADPSLLYGEYGMYVPGESLSKAPKGYEPVYIAIYCRHGARYALQESVYEDVLGVFQMARDSARLTAKGEDFLKRYEVLYPHVAHKGGILTDKGRRQLYDMGAKMVKDYPSVFKGQTRGRGVATSILRTQESMKSFIEGVKSEDGDFDTSFDAGEKYNFLLLPRDAPVAEKINLSYTPEATESLNAFTARHSNPAGFLEKFFTDMAFVSRHAKPGLLQKWMRTVIVDLPCIDYESPDRFEDIFTFDELYDMWRIWNYRGYLMMGNSPLMFEECSKVCEPALAEIIRNVDEDLSSGLRLNMMFSHDVGLLPLLSYMHVSNFGASVADPERVEDYWDSSYCTMAANLQLIFYRNRKGDILVKPLLNGAETTLPFQSVKGPYYSWKAFKDYYRK